MLSRTKTAFFLCLFLCLAALTYTYLSNYKTPLWGANPHRQADTLFSAYSYCKEDTSFLKPKVLARGETAGVSIGEFPPYSYLLSLPCQLTGQWSESLLRLGSPILYILLIFLFGYFFLQKLGLSKKDLVPLMCLLGFNYLHLKYLLPPYPDVLALIFIAASALILNRSIHSKKSNLYLQALGVLLFTLGFLIRPYLFPLMFLISSDRKVLVSIAASLFIAYIGWYRMWASQVSDLSYYAIQIRDFFQSFQDLPKGLASLFFDIPKLHVNYILLPLLLMGLLKNKALGILWIASIFSIHALAGAHYVSHEYYLLSTSIIGLFLAAKTLWSFQKPQLVYGVLSAYVVLGTAAIIYHWSYPPIEDWKKAGEYIQQNTSPTDLIAVFADGGPSYLYASQRFGWNLPPNSYKGPESCPDKAEWALIKSEGEPKLIPCSD